MSLLSMATSGGARTVKLLFPFQANAVGLWRTRHAGLQLLAAWPDSAEHVPFEFHQPCAMQGQTVAKSPAHLRRRVITVFSQHGRPGAALPIEPAPSVYKTAYMSMQNLHID